MKTHHTIEAHAGTRGWWLLAAGYTLIATACYWNPEAVLENPFLDGVDNDGYCLAGSDATRDFDCWVPTDPTSSEAGYEMADTLAEQFIVDEVIKRDA